MGNSGKSNTTFSTNDEKQIEQFVGIDIYSTSKIEGIGGIYKHNPKDFIVKEITEKGYVLQIEQDNISSSFSKESKDKYSTFNLIKINKDTFEAIKLLSNALNIPLGSIFYSGLKDKLSISVQKVSIRGDYIEKLRKLKLNDIFVRNIYPSRKPVKLGSNRGNHFIITIRNIKKSKNLLKRINKIFKILQIQGFPNYFGLQRFGTFRPNSHLLGKFILENKFKEAFDELVIKIYPTESKLAQKARNELNKTGDFKEAYRKFPDGLNYEKTLIKYLMENPNDFHGAINELPKYLIKLLISSFQSYLFNRMLSLRIKKGLPLFKPVKGDIISILDDINGQCTQIIYRYGGNYDKYLREAFKLNRAAIVIPLIGYDTNLKEFPLMEDLINEIFREENIDKNLFNNELLSDYDFKGTIRAMIVKPFGLFLLEFTEDNIFQGRFKLKIEFSLQKGSYATMLLRELMK